MKTSSFQQNQQASQMTGHSASRAPGRGRALYEEFRARIADGTYGTGAPLPSTRALPPSAGSRATVSLVYEQLAAEGYLQTRAGAASRVAAHARAPAAPPPCAVDAPGTAPTAAGRLSAIGQRIAARIWP
jgi:GntR family transcriptional regulator/MocR family aminotransferase